MNPNSSHTPSGKPSIALRAVRHARRNVIAYLALFLALSGSAYAVEKASVGTKQLKKNAVKTAKIANGAVTSKKLAAGSVDTGKLTDGAVQTGKLGDGAVAGGKLAAGSVTRDKLAPGAVGPDQVGLVRHVARMDDTTSGNPGTFTEIYKHGPFSIRTRCIDGAGNDPTYGNVYVKSTEQASSTGLQNSPAYRVEPDGDWRPTGATMTLNGTGVTAVNLWSSGGSFLQLSVVATALPSVAKNDCAFLLTGYAG